ncbi:MAG: hypothetical protein M3Q39_00035 [Actinomycetota bacterium]|nr:hypothetical protein [Actinomycetota bacterium]
MSERMWPGLNPVAADGLACVVCGRDFRTPGSVSMPVGRSHTGSQVFACDPVCVAATGEPVVGHRAARGEPTATRPAVVPLGVPVDAIDALSDAALSFYAQDLAAALRDTAGPLVVAAELRRLAAEWDPQLDDPHATHGERHHRGGIAVVCEALRDRATELDGPAGGAS